MAQHKDTKNMTLRLDESLAENAQTIASVEGTSVSEVIRDALSEHIERRRTDPDFQALLKRNIERQAQLLDMLADG